MRDNGRKRHNSGALGLGLVIGLVVGLHPLPGAALTLSVDREQVREWNRFADALYQLHQRQIAGRQIRTEESMGGYAGREDFYREVKYFDTQTDRLLSEIQWEADAPDTIHAITVYRYDADGRLSQDYLARYLPEHRNAPVQTLVNLHHRDDELQAFRQFDASNARIYEQCRGRFFGESILVSLEENEIPHNAGDLPPGVSDELYASCFGSLPSSAEQYLDALLRSPQVAAQHDGSDERDAVEQHIQQLTDWIAIAPDKPEWYVQRGQLYFRIQEFELAISDYSKAIELDDGQDDAWFGRGMARARAGHIAAGIDDLSVYIRRHPDSSRAHTKRGVRYIWLGELSKAQQDLTRAIALDPTNAEAHDDLGVIYAQQQRYDQATAQFQAAIDHDPRYQKAYHNLAMVRHLDGQHDAALRHVEQALRLSPASRNSLMLKAAILEAMGRQAEARTLTEHAEFLPEGNWSERFPLQ